MIPPWMISKQAFKNSSGLVFRDVHGQPNPSFSRDPPSYASSRNSSIVSIQLTPSESKPKPEPEPQQDTTDSRNKERSFLSAIRSFIIVLALSIHAIFEGMAIGETFGRCVTA